MVTISPVEETEEEKSNVVPELTKEATASDETTATTMPPSLSEIPSGWTELMGKDLVMKSIDSPDGETATAIQHQDMVLVDWVGYQANVPIEKESMSSDKNPIFHDVKNVWVTIGDKGTTPALEMGIRFAHSNETAMVWSHSKFAYGPTTRTHDNYVLPPHSNVQYEIKIRKVVSAEQLQQDGWKWALTDAESKKNLANDAYVTEWSNGQGKSRIMYLYQKTAKDLQVMLDTSATTDDKEEDETTTQQKQKAKEILLDCLNNICAVELRDKQYHQAKAAAVKVLEQDPTNFKGLIRAAKAALLDPASSYEEVDAAIAAAAEQASNVQLSDVKKLQADFRRRKKAYEQKSQKMYAKALNGSGKKKEKESTETESNNDTTKSDEPEPIATPQTNEQDAAEAMTMPPEPLPFSWSNWRTWPWASIGAYAVQLSMPFVMYYVATSARKNGGGGGIPQEFQSAATASSAMPDSDEF